MGECFTKRSESNGLIDLSRFQDASVDVVRFASVNMEYGMMRMDTLTPVLTVTTEKLETAWVFSWLIHKPDRKVFWEYFALAQENTKRVLSIH